MDNLNSPASLQLQLLELKHFKLYMSYGGKSVLAGKKIFGTLIVLFTYLFFIIYVYASINHNNTYI